MKKITIIFFALSFLKTNAQSHTFYTYGRKATEVEKISTEKLIKNLNDKSRSLIVDSSILNSSFTLNKNVEMPKPVTLENYLKMLETLDNRKTSNAQRNEIINQLTKISKNDSLSEDEKEKIVTLVDEFKVYNTTNGFLTTKFKPSDFCISKAKYFDADTFNKFVNGQYKLSAFQNFTLQNFNEATTISSEFASAYFGFIRLGISGYLTLKGDSAKSDETVKKDLQKMITNGGVLSLNFSMPLWLTRDRKDRRHAGLYAHTNFGINPAIDSSSKRKDVSQNILFNNQTGLNLHLDFTSSGLEDKIMIFLDLPMYYVWGSKKTYDYLGLKDYFIAKANIGVSVYNKFAFKISGPLLTSSEKIRDTPWLMTLIFGGSPSSNQ